MKFIPAFLMLAMLIFSCAKTKKEQTAKNQATRKEFFMTGERTKGPTKVYDSINGQPLFILNDNVLIDCGTLYKDWYDILLYVDIKLEEYEMDTVKKGRKLKYGEEEVGEILMDMPSYNARSGDEAWIRLWGVVPKENIRPESIVESALSRYSNGVGKERTLDEYDPFIKDFQLQSSSQFGEYKVFFKYESSVDDPSPGFRIALVFDNDRLVAVLHSRALELEGAADHKMEHGFSCFIYPDVDEKNEIIDLFNRFFGMVG